MLADSEDKHTLSVPLSQSYPVELKHLLDEIEDKVSGSRRWPGWFPTRNLGASSAATEAVRSAAREILAFRNPASLSRCSQRISLVQLLKLQECINEMQSFVNVLRRGLMNVMTTLNRREDRYKLVKANGDITVFMKSRGLGSSLYESQSADEEWIETFDDWGMPAQKPPRQRIHDGKRVVAKPPAVFVGFQ